MDAFLELAEANRREAQAVIGQLDLAGRWRAVGVEPRLVGSLRMGLLGKHRDIDFHVYSDPVSAAADFRMMGELAGEHPQVRSVEYRNLLDTDEACLEWHLGYENPQTGHLWQVDMIHILKGSRYDGFFEAMADRVCAALTEETRAAVLRLKCEEPEGEEKVPGVEYYEAVLCGGVRDYAGFSEWRRRRPGARVAYGWWKSL